MLVSHLSFLSLPSMGFGLLPTGLRARVGSVCFGYFWRLCAGDRKRAGDTGIGDASKARFQGPEGSGATCKEGGPGRKGIKEEGGQRKSDGDICCCDSAQRFCFVSQPKRKQSKGGRGWRESEQDRTVNRVDDDEAIKTLLMLQSTLPIMDSIHEETSSPGDNRRKEGFSSARCFRQRVRGQVVGGDGGGTQGAADCRDNG